jgi:phospholipid transport system substrate-binding protein
MNNQRQNTLASIALAIAVAFAGLLTNLIQAPTQAAYAAEPRDQGAEQFVQAQGQRMVSILADKSQSMADKILAFRAALIEIADVPRITRFVLGRYSRTITPEQMQRFAPVFQDYAQDVYQKSLTDFHADTLTVTGSLVRNPGDVVVRTTITGGDDKQPMLLSWRVSGTGSSWKVVDVEASGVWLAISQQNEFVSIIDNHRGSIDALISRLQEMTRGQAAPAAANQ